MSDGVTDREKVIEGVRCHWKMLCSRCPYHEDAHDDKEEYCGRGQLFKDAITLLKEQDTVEHALSVLKAHGWKESESTYCPNCGAYVEVGK